MPRPVRFLCGGFSFQGCSRSFRGCGNIRRPDRGRNPCARRIARRTQEKMTPRRTQTPHERPPGFIYRETKHGLLRRAGDSVLHCEDAPLTKLAEKYGTPLYLYSAATIHERYSTFDRAFREV